MTDDPRVFREPPSRLHERAFVERFGAGYQDSPWLAQATFRHGLSEAQDTVAGLAEAFADTLARAGRERQLALIRAHPDLAGRAALRGELSAASSGEQAGAGLDQCSPEELQRFQTLNRAYRQRFGFPFVIAVRGRDRGEILAAFEARFDNDPQTEFAQSLGRAQRHRPAA